MKTEITIEPSPKCKSQSVMTKATFIVETGALEQIKALAFWERKHLKVLIKQAIDNFLLTKEEHYRQQALSCYKKALQNSQDIDI